MHIPAVPLLEFREQLVSEIGLIVFGKTMDGVGNQETFDRWHGPAVDLLSSTSALNINHSTLRPPQPYTQTSHSRWSYPYQYG